MSSSIYPLGMKRPHSSGYIHNITILHKQNVCWKGTGINSNPTGMMYGNIRPLTNNDTGNVFQTGFGLARPIKHFRKGRVILSEPIVANGVNPENGNIPITKNQTDMINYNINRHVKSSNGTTLGGKFGLLNDIQDKPGGFSVSVNKGPIDCNTCKGIKFISSYYPNSTFLQENPTQSTQSKGYCCNDEKKAKRRSMYASTNLKKNYYTTSKQYLQNRCKTFEQKSFNFLSYRTNSETPESNPYYITANKQMKPGGPLALSNTYQANCQPNAEILSSGKSAIISKMLNIMVNMEILTQEQVDLFNTLGINTLQGFFEWLNGLPENQKTQSLNVFTDIINNPYFDIPFTNLSACKLTVYKPNNYQYAKQGAVDSSTRNLKLKINTISTNAASIQNFNNTGPLLVNSIEINSGYEPNQINLYKNKAPMCTETYPLNMQRPFQNKTNCAYAGTHVDNI